MPKKGVKKVRKSKHAARKLKKISIIMSIICSIAIIALLIFGVYKLNIIKLKGDASKTYETGDEFCLDTECFRVIRETNDGKVIAIAKYNLLVGDMFDESTEMLSPISTDTKGYGLQSSSAKGYVDGADKHIGLVQFALDNDEHKSYWWDYENNTVKDNYEVGTNQTVYVYSDDSETKKYVDAYQTKLNKKFKTVSARLLNYKDYLWLSCKEDSTTDCGDPSYLWLYNSTYWSGVALANESRDSEVAVIIAEQGMTFIDFYEIGLGVRPVIEIPKSDIPENDGFKYKHYKKGEEFCIKSECFNTIRQDAETVTGLAKYNLNVGYNVTYGESEVLSQEPVSTDEKTYGLQDETKKGWYRDDTESSAVLSFINTNDDMYWYVNGEIPDEYKKNIDYEGYEFQSPDAYDGPHNLRIYVENYVKKLKELSGYTGISARLFNYKDYLYFIEGSDQDLPSWYRPTTFWTSIADRGYIGCFYKNTDEAVIEVIDSTLPVAGVRPVVTVSKEELEPKKETTTSAVIRTNAGKKLSSDHFKTIMVDDDEITTTTKATTKVNNLNKKIVTVNKTNYDWIYVLIIINGIIFIIILIEIILLIREKRKQRKA